MRQLIDLHRSSLLVQRTGISSVFSKFPWAQAWRCDLVSHTSSKLLITLHFNPTSQGFRPLLPTKWIPYTCIWENIAAFYVLSEPSARLRKRSPGYLLNHIPNSEEKNKMSAYFSEFNWHFICLLYVTYQNCSQKCHQLRHCPHSVAIEVGTHISHEGSEAGKRYPTLRNQVYRVIDSSISFVASSLV